MPQSPPAHSLASWHPAMAPLGFGPRTPPAFKGQIVGGSLKSFIVRI